MPLLDGLFDAMAFSAEAANPEAAVGGWSRLGERVESLLAELSRISPVAYVYTEYFGGVGEQSALAYVAGNLATHHGGSGLVLPWSASAGPINSALAAIGVVRDRGQDEFDSLRLGQHRSMDDLESGEHVPTRPRKPPKQEPAQPDGRTSATIKAVLLIRSDHFSFDCPVENGMQYDCPLGDDLAALLRAKIEARGKSWRILDPIREDYGTELLCYQGKKCLRITVTWHPMGTGLRVRDEERWVLQFSQSHGCWGGLFRVRDDMAALSELRGLADEIVRAEPTVFLTATWLSEQELIAMERGSRPASAG